MKESFWFGAGSPAFFSLAFFESIYIFVKLMFSANIPVKLHDSSHDFCLVF